LRKSADSLPHVPHAGYVSLDIEAEMAVHHFVFRDRTKTLPELVANNGINAGLVLAETETTIPLEFWRTARAL
jgi:hypothetical protein